MIEKNVFLLYLSADIEEEIQTVREEILRNEAELEAKKQENEKLKLELVGVLDEQFNLLVRYSFHPYQ